MKGQLPPPTDFFTVPPRFWKVPVAPIALKPASVWMSKTASGLLFLKEYPSFMISRPAPLQVATPLLLKVPPQVWLEELVIFIVGWAARVPKSIFAVRVPPLQSRVL